MKREEKLRQVAYKFYKAAQEEKRVKAEREELRSDLFRLLDYDFKGKDHLLPVRTFEVPEQFFRDTGLSYDEFVKTRSPGWKVEHVEKNVTTDLTTFVLKKDPNYVNRIIEVDADEGKIQVSKEISEYPPEIDWETLVVERPDLYEKLAKEVVVIQLNDEELEKLFEEQPEELAVLQRHMVVKQPVIRIVPRKVKDDG